MDLKVVEYEKKDGVAILTMNYLERFNALSDQIRADLRTACAEACNDDEVKALILTGKEKAFCAGGDISGFKFDTASVKKFIRDIINFLGMMEKISKPVIAAVNGLALGGGLELAISCDIIIASEKAKFGVPEANIGLVPGFAILRLPEIIGRAKAKEMAMTCEPISAEEALRLGLVSKVVPHDQLFSSAMEMAQKIISKAPFAVELIKSSINRKMHGEELEYAYESVGLLFKTDDAKEGITAFREKRKPTFKRM